LDDQTKEKEKEMSGACGMYAGDLMSFTQENAVDLYIIP
jgi:hypothetical protein